MDPLREPDFGDEGVDEAGDEVEVVIGEFAEGSDAVAEDVLSGVEWPSGDVVDEEVVDADVEALGEADERVG